MTEAGPVLAMCLAFAREPYEIKSGACGTVVRNAEMKIVDPETGSTLPRNQPGEICIRGDQIMKGKLGTRYTNPQRRISLLQKSFSFGRKLAIIISALPKCASPHHYP